MNKKWPSSSLHHPITKTCMNDDNVGGLIVELDRIWTMNDDINDGGDYR